MSYLEILHVDEVSTKEEKEWRVTFRDMLDGSIAIRNFRFNDPFSLKLDLPKGKKHAKQIEGYIAEQNGVPVVVLPFESIKNALSKQLY